MVEVTLCVIGEKEDKKAMNKENERMIPKLLEPGEGQTVHLLGEPRTFKVTSAENGGLYLQFETAHAP